MTRMTLGYPGEHQTKQNRCGNANPLRLDSEMFGVCVCEAIQNPFQPIQTPTTTEPAPARHFQRTRSRG